MIMNHYYALTITPTSCKPLTEATFNKALSRYERKLNVIIESRFYEVAPKMRKLHLHATLRSDSNTFKFIAQSNHNFVCKPITDLSGWLDYSRKSKKIRLV